jgi:hypothetical protein
LPDGDELQAVTRQSHHGDHGPLDATLANASNRAAAASTWRRAGIMPKRSLIGTIVLCVVLAVAFAGYLWWRYSVDEKLGYCQTPQQTCVNREGIPVGQPCECHGPGGGVFGLDSKGTVIPR